MADGMTFDSRKEYNRFCELALLEKAHQIQDLQMQVRFELIPSQKVNGRTERAVTYIADFCYWENGHKVVEDVKSKATKTPQYILKRKMMLYFYGIEVREIG